MKTKSGFVTIVGKPNVGKSTLMNKLIGEDLSIITNKPQTTRKRIMGIFDEKDFQIIFLDTPGIHNAKTKLGEYMTSSAISTIKAVDLVLFFVNAYDDVKESNLKIMDKLENIKTPVFLIINKLDTITDFQRLEAAIKPYKDKCAFAGVFAVSALTGQYVDLLMKDIKNMLPEGPKYYPDGALSDRPETFLIQEFIREKILDNTREEVPHAVAVYIERMQHKKELTRIDATIVVERDSQKAIVIGKNGARLKKIGTDARLDIEELLGRSVYLDLFCKVEPNWRNRDHYLKTYGYKPEKK